MHRYIQILLILIAAPFILIILPVLALIVKCKLGSPIIFEQLRIGLAGKPFKLYKFRSMIDAYDVDGNSIADSLRLTRFGRILRSTSLDELPSFWCVLKGDMSLVGPRPLLPEYLPLYTPYQAIRHSVLPGITGWAQVNGRNALSWEEKFEFDIWYVANRSFWLDVKIIFLTVKKVVVRQGISADNEETMPRFTGTKGDAK